MTSLGCTGVLQMLPVYKWKKVHPATSPEVIVFWMPENIECKWARLGKKFKKKKVTQTPLDNSSGNNDNLCFLMVFSKFYKI